MADGPFLAVAGRRSHRGFFHRRLRLAPVGNAGSAVATGVIFTGPARVTHVAIDYGSAVPATTDVTIKAANGSTGGTTLLSRANSATDLSPSVVGSPAAVNASNGATAATDGVEGGWLVQQGVYVDVAQADPAFVVATDAGTETKLIFVDIWYQECDLLQVSLFPSGADGSAAATRLIKTAKAGNIVGLSVDFGAGVPATTDLVIKTDVKDDASGGFTAFTATNANTDIGTRFAGVGLGSAGIDEGGAAIAATDAAGGGFPFARVVYITVAQADNYTADEDIFVQLWCTR